MRSWLPVPGTTSGRLMEAALELFGAQGFGSVGVVAIAERAGVTTGSIYHHFGSKEGLYRLARHDIEHRVVDRLEGAAAARPVASTAALAPVLLVGFDYLVASGYARLLAEPAPEVQGAPERPDPIEQLVASWIPDGTTLAVLVAASWRAALGHASGGPASARNARDAVERLFTAPS